MKNTLLKALLITSSVLVANLAHADFYVGGGLYQSTLDFDSDFGDDDDKAMTLFAGWKPPIIPFLSVEVAYHDLGSYKLTEDTANTVIKGDVEALSAQAVVAFPIIIFDIYGKLGYAKTDFDASINGIKDNDSSSDPYFALGLALTMIPIIDIYAEYQRFELSDDNRVDLFGLGVKATF